VTTRLLIAIQDDPTPVWAEVDLDDDGEPPPVRFRGEWYYPTHWRTMTGSRLVYKTEADLRAEAEEEAAK